jgi:hypothetical protein
MAMKLAPRPIPEKAPPVKAKSYLAWLHELPCVVSGRSPVEAAHVNYAAPSCGAFGRGKGQKASDRWALPLHPDLHRAQHDFGDERGWWELQGINPHMAGLVLWGLWKERGDDATSQAERLIRSRAFAEVDIPGENQ